MKSHRVMLAVIAGLALVASMPVRADDKPVTLARSYKKGDVTRTNSEASVNANGTDVQVVQTAKITIKDVKDNGQIVIEEAGEGGKVTIGGSDMDMPASYATTATRDKNGKLIEFKMDEGGQTIYTPEITHLLQIVGSPVLSDKEVKPGEI